jgi:hypothetical protein
MKQTAVEFIEKAYNEAYLNMWTHNVPIHKDFIPNLFKQAKEIEQEQIEESFNKGFKLAFNGCATLNLEESQFNEWLEQSKKQRCQHDFVRTSDSFDLTTYCKKCGVNF